MTRPGGPAPASSQTERSRRLQRAHVLAVAERLDVIDEVLREELVEPVKAARVHDVAVQGDKFIHGEPVLDA